MKMPPDSAEGAVPALQPEKSEAFSSSRYWENRYANGGNSGAGSGGKFAHFKAETVNRFVALHNITSVIEFGSGDGRQLELAVYPAYRGFDVSLTAVERCREIFASDPTKVFSLLGDYNGEKAELGLSLDVVFHLIEDAVYERYLSNLFAAATRFVIIYSSNDTGIESSPAPHVKHRVFTEWVQRNLPNWKLIGHMPNLYPFRGDHVNGSFSEFYFFELTDK